MKIKEIGEFGLIDLIGQDAIVNSENVVVGIGDDAAVLRVAAGMLQLMSTDMLVEGIHFDLAFMSPFQLGYKALAVNLSDIAAMGGQPEHVVIALAIPERLDTEFVIELYRGMKAIAKQFGVNIVGGDTVGSRKDLVINVTVTGQVQPEYLQRRSTAQPGDLVVVTGQLGSSAAGLACLQNGRRKEEFAQPLIAVHLQPLPQLKIAQLIAQYASSMNDISDGLASEAQEIAVASRVGIRLTESSLPCAKELKTAAVAMGSDYLDFILYGGEDYQLLFTITAENYEHLCRESLTEKLTVIGCVNDKVNCVELETKTATIVKIQPKGYNHFR